MVAGIALLSRFSPPIYVDTGATSLLTYMFSGRTSTSMTFSNLSDKKPSSIVYMVFPLIDCTPSKYTNEDITYDNYDHDHFLLEIDLMQILDLIEPEVSHWEIFRFHAILHGYIQPLLSRLHRLPSAPLKRLRYACAYWWLWILQWWPPSFPRKRNFARRHRLLGRPRRLPQFAPFPPGLTWIWIILPSWLHLTIFSQILKDSPNLRSLLFASSSPTLAVGAQYDDEGQWGPEPFEIPSIHYLQFEYHEVPSSNTFISPTCATLYCVSRAKIAAPSCVTYWFLLKPGPNPSFLDLKRSGSQSCVVM